MRDSARLSDLAPGSRPVPVGVPNFFIEKFRIPPFLLPIYQAAGIQYGVRWEVLAAINEIETDYGRNLNVSSAGAMGWMQFIPSSWKLYGVDANNDGKKDPYNPVDAIFAAARYLKAAGADTDLRKAIFAYNHADWYVESVLMRARLIGGLPTDLVSSLTTSVPPEFSRRSVTSPCRNAHSCSPPRAETSSSPKIRSSVHALSSAGASVMPMMVRMTSRVSGMPTSCEMSTRSPAIAAVTRFCVSRASHGRYSCTFAGEKNGFTSSRHRLASGGS